MSAAAANIKSALTCQDRRRSLGLCIRCAKPLSPRSRHFCAACHEASNAYNRNLYRAKQGIPQDAPIGLHAGGRERWQLCLALEAACRRALRLGPSNPA